MDLVDIHDVLLTLLLNAVHDLLDAVLEVATILCACQQRSDVELVDLTALEALRHTTFFDHPRQPPDEGSLSHTGLTDMQRVVLVATAEHLDGTFQLVFPTYQRIMLSVEVVHTGHQSAPRSFVFGLARL